MKNELNTENIYLGRSQNPWSSVGSLIIIMKCAAGVLNGHACVVSSTTF